MQAACSSNGREESTEFLTPLHPRFTGALSTMNNNVMEGKGNFRSKVFSFILFVFE